VVRYLPFREKKDLKGVKAGSTLPVFADVQSCSNKGDVYTDKKENNIFHIYREIQMGLGAKLYIRKGFLIYE
jgi:hypothetical protein